MSRVGPISFEMLERRCLLSTVSASSGAAQGPSAVLKITLSSPPSTTEPVIFTMTYRDADGVDPTAFDNRDVRISGPNGFARYARAISSSSNVDGSRRTVRYKMSAPGGAWDTGDNGAYAVRLQGDAIFDQSGNASLPQRLGRFTVRIGPIALASPHITRTFTPAPKTPLINSLLD